VFEARPRGVGVGANGNGRKNRHGELLLEKLIVGKQLESVTNRQKKEGAVDYAAPLIGTTVFRNLRIFMSKTSDISTGYVM